MMTGSAALKPKVGSMSETWNDAPEQEDGFEWDAYN